MFISKFLINSFALNVRPPVDVNQAVASVIGVNPWHPVVD